MVVGVGLAKIRWPLCGARLPRRYATVTFADLRRAEVLHQYCRSSEVGSSVVSARSTDRPNDKWIDRHNAAPHVDRKSTRTPVYRNGARRQREGARQTGRQSERVGEAEESWLNEERKRTCAARASAPLISCGQHAALPTDESAFKLHSIIFSAVQLVDF